MARKHQAATTRVRGDMARRSRSRPARREHEPAAAEAVAMSERANALFDQINANVDDWYAEKTDSKTFDQRQRDTWDQIYAAGPMVVQQVLRAIRARLPTASRAV